MIRFPKEQLVRYRHKGAGLLVVAYERQLKTIKSMSEKMHSIELENSKAWERVEQLEKQIKNYNEHYKPKEQDMNEWHEKGELPPVGEVCILASVGFTELNHEVEITYIGDGVGCYRLLKNNQEYTVNLGDAKFRPIHTETDEVVEQMCNDAIIGRDKDVKLNPVIVAAIERLAEQGYRKIKPMSEQEFMKQCVDICGHGSTLLYRAGCRFIDVCDERKLTESD